MYLPRLGSAPPLRSAAVLPSIAVPNGAKGASIEFLKHTQHPAEAHSIQRVLLVVQSTVPGGMETHCIEVAAELVSRGITVGAVIPDATLAAQFQSVGAEVIVLRTDARDGRFAQLRGWPSLARSLRRWRPDVVHLHTGGTTGGLAVVLAARLATRAAVVCTEHDVPSPRQACQRGRALKWASDQLCHTLIAVSRRNAAIRRERLGAPRHTFAALLNGVSIPKLTEAERLANRRRVRAELGIDERSLVIGSLVRLAPGKGLPDLLRAFAVVTSRVPCTLLLVGDGPLRDELRALASELGVAHQLRFAGEQSRPMPFLDAMDVFVLPVPAGSMSIALLEAMARALPPVITFAGPEEAVVPEVTGLSAPPSDPDGLAEALLRLAKDGELRARLGATAAAYVRQHFSTTRLVNDLLELYSEARQAAVPQRLRADASPEPRPVVRET